jgi:hypothetical protein
MKKAYLLAALSLASVLGIGIRAHAQDIDSVIVTVPFEFVAGGATLPAGEYRVGRVNPGANRELTMSSYNKRDTFLLPTAYETVSSNHPTLSFEHVGDKYFLSKIQTLDTVYTMPKSHETLRQGQTNTAGAMSSPGTMSASGTH